MKKYSDNPVIKDIELFREQLWQLCIENAQGLTSEECVRALEAITDDLYEGTIDQAYDRTDFQNPDSLASLWDCIWISSYARKLKRIKRL